MMAQGVYVGQAVCPHCEATFLCTFEDGEKYVRCPQCDNLVPVPTTYTNHPTGRCTRCNRPLDEAHIWERVPSGWRILACIR